MDGPARQPQHPLASIGLKPMKWIWSRDKPKGPVRHDFCEEVAADADKFVQYAEQKGGWLLDYSENSIEMVETVIGVLSRDYDRLSSEERSSIVHDCGSYVLEVGRRQFGGRYKFYTERGQVILVVGEPEFSAAFLAHGKVEGRLRGDPEENLPFHYRGLREAVALKQSVLYV